MILHREVSEVMNLAYPGELAALATAVCWTVTAMSFESAGKRVGSLTVNWLRLILALPLFVVVCGLYRGLPFPTDASASVWFWLVLSGIVGFNIGDLCLFRAFVLLGSRLSMLVMSLVPPVIALASWLILGERLRALDWLGMCVTLLGVAWVVSLRSDAAKIETDKEGRTHRVQGLLLALGGVVGQSLGLVLGKFGMGDYDPVAATQIRVIAGAIGFTILFFFINWWPRVRPVFRDRFALSRIALGAIFGPFLGVSLSFVAVQLTEAGVAATIMSLTPVLILGPTAWIYRQRITWPMLLGALLAVGGSAILFL